MDDRQVTFNRKAVRPIQCVREGWDLIKADYWLFLGISFVGTLIASMAPMAILVGPMMCGIYFCLFRQQRGEPIKFEMLFRGFDYFIQSLVASLIMIIPLVAIIVPAYILFIFAVVASTPPPGGPPNPNAAWAMLGGMGFFYVTIFLVSVVVSVFFYFIFPLIVDRKLTGVQAVKVSFRAALANFWGVLGVVLLTQLLSLVGTMACCVGVIFVMPIHFAAVAVSYRKVFPPEELILEPPTDGPEADYGPHPKADDY